MEPQPFPGPMRRRGPRPLAQHLIHAMLLSAASNVESPTSSAASIPLSPNHGAAPERAWPDAELIAGIAAYRRHPWQREQPEQPVIWREGATRLLDYSQPSASSALPVAPTLLFVPSLVNRAHILDLLPQRSMLRFLAARGVRPLLLDWGWPDARSRQFSLTDYIAGRLERAVVAADAPALVLVGYCMGGLLALAAALRRPDRIAALVLLATPWDFHADPAASAPLAQLRPLLEAALLTMGQLPVDALQMLFAAIDPGAVAAKYRAFAALDPQSERATLFMAVEDWANDGVPLAASVARECLDGWYGANTPARGEWLVAGLPVDPTALRMPCLVVVPDRDRIVPPDAALPLAGLIPGSGTHRIDTGHIGMAAGAHAAVDLWQPMLDWVRSLPP